MIDVETDSTVAPDAQAEQESVTTLLTAMTQFMQATFPMLQAGQITVPQLVAMLRFAIRPFRGARHIEEVLDDAIRQAEQGQGQQQSDPNEQAERQKQEMELEKQRIGLQTAQVKGQSAIQKEAISLAKARAGNRQ